MNLKLTSSIIGELQFTSNHVCDVCDTRPLAVPMFQNTQGSSYRAPRDMHTPIGDFTVAETLAYAYLNIRSPL
jgi:hypothetical protein